MGPAFIESPCTNIRIKAPHGVFSLLRPSYDDLCPKFYSVIVITVIV